MGHTFSVDQNDSTNHPASVPMYPDIQMMSTVHEPHG